MTKNGRNPAMTDVARLFNERAAHFTAQGYFGADLFKQLAADTELPFTFTAEDQAAIERIQKETIRMRRKRGIGPASVKQGNTVTTFRPDYCKYLSDQFVTPQRRK